MPHEAGDEISQASKEARWFETSELKTLSIIGINDHKEVRL